MEQERAGPVWRTLLRWFLCLIALALVLAGMLPALSTDWSLVRMLDYPRAQLLAVTVLVFVLLMWVGRGRGLAVPVALLGLLAVGAWHMAKLAPVVLRPALAAAAPTCDEAAFTVLIANVQRGNRQAEPLIALVREVRPDVFVAQETDAWWNEALSALSDLLPHTEAAIMEESYYGMHLFSRHEIASAEILHPTDPDTPVIRAQVRLPSGPVTVLGVHPRPPLLDQSTVPRDGELLEAALRIDRDVPTILAGDLNAVPWETTLRRMRRLGGLLDPRERAGFLATFDAKSTWMRWPLDQILHTRGLTAIRAEVLAGFGSDHFPYLVELCPRPAADAAPEPLPGDMATADRTIARARDH